jgi:hypothetical protein
MPPAKTIITVLILVILTVSAAYVIVGDQEESADTGWCCVAVGQECEGENTVDTCRAKGGLLFTAAQDICLVSCNSPSTHAGIPAASR